MEKINSLNFNLIKIIQKKNNNNKLFFLFIIFLLSPTLSSFKYFRAYNLDTDENEILLITQEGIILKYPDETNPKNIYSSELFTSADDIKYISFTQLRLFDETYLFCRVKEFLYILSYNLNSWFFTLKIEDMAQSEVSLNAYTDKENNNLIIVSYVSAGKELIIKAYKILESDVNLKNNINKKIEKDGTTEYLFENGGVSCQMMKSPNYENDLFICFVGSESSYLNGLVFDPENSFSYKYLVTYNTQIGDIKIVKSAVSADKAYCFICLEVNEQNYGCIIYDFIHNIWSQFNLFINYSLGGYEYDFEIYYLKDNNEYLVYFPNGFVDFNIYTFDEQFQIKSDENGDKCYLKFSETSFLEKYSSTIIYNNNKYIILSSIRNENGDDFTINDIPTECSDQIDFTGYELSEQGSSASNSQNDDSTQSSSTTNKAVISTIIFNPSTILTASPYINPSTIITTSFLAPSSIITSSTYINNNPSTIINIKSTSPYIDSKITTNIESTLIHQISNSDLQTSLMFPSTIYEINPSKISPSIYPLIQISPSSRYNSDIPSNNIDIIFYDEGEVIKGKLNKTKENLEDEIDKIINIIEIGQKYKIDGDDYNITISPIDEISYFDTYIDFLECEDILRLRHNLSDKEVLTIMQIEIDKMVENTLANQIEYAVYDEKRNKLNLSFCQELEIKINYYIKNNSLLNVSMLSYYSDLGIDVLDIEDSFFNDICYPFSNTNNSDVILIDRVSDIYQNLSLCDNNCDYDEIDLENMTVSCTCSIKTTINTTVDPPFFVGIVKDTFKESSFGVIKCYNLVFDFKDKIHNIGFLILFISIIINASLFIVYFIHGINSIKIFIFKEMSKYNFLIIRAHPIKKKIKTEKKENFKLNNSSNNCKNLSFSNDKLTIISSNNKSNCIKNKITNIKKIKDNKIPFFIGDKNSKSQINNITIINNNNNIIKVNKLDKKIKIKPEHSSVKNFKSKNRNIIKNRIYNNEKGKSFPGYYNLFHVNPNFSSNNKPYESKYILDNYEYSSAIKYDNRTFWRIFYICLLSKENILNTFFFKSPLEIQALRLSIFLFNTSCDLAFNSLFYFQQNISDKYHYEGDNLYYFTLVNNITITVVSTLSTFVLVKSLNFLTNSKDAIIDVFRIDNKTLNNNKNKSDGLNINFKKKLYTKLNKLLKCMKIKIVIYILVEFLIHLFFFYYIVAFCEVYKATQISWIIDCVISLLLSILGEFLISFIISILYIIAIRYRFRILYNLVLFIYGLG